MNTNKLTYTQFKSNFVKGNLDEAIDSLMGLGLTYDVAEFQIESHIKSEYELYLSNEYYPEP